MPFSLDEVVPWGRSYAEYCRMFDLGEGLLHSRILGCADGPASFNATLIAEGGDVVSVDPIYAFERADLERRIDETWDILMGKARAREREFLWTDISSVEELGRLRRQAMQQFLDDYEDGSAAGRYRAASVPDLPFEDAEFDLSVCSHFLFHYSEVYSRDFHETALRELLRVSREVRVFPLRDMSGRPSDHLGSIRHHFEGEGFDVEVRRVDYELRRGMNEMLRIRRPHH